MLVVGETGWLPEVGLMDPTPGLITALVALEIVQLKIELCPELIVVGLALKEMVGGCPVVPFTFTVTWAVLLPPGPQAVSV